MLCYNKNFKQYGNNAIRLNPYCNGICSATRRTAKRTTAYRLVLILIVMEYALLHYHICKVEMPMYEVLILIVMEYALLRINIKNIKENGNVLILIVMEYALLQSYYQH